MWVLWRPLHFTGIGSKKHKASLLLCILDLSEKVTKLLILFSNFQEVWWCPVDKTFGMLFCLTLSPYPMHKGYEMADVKYPCLWCCFIFGVKSLLQRKGCIFRFSAPLFNISPALVSPLFNVSPNLVSPLLSASPVLVFLFLDSSPALATPLLNVSPDFVSLLLYAYVPVRVFNLIWRPSWPHFGVLQNSPNIGKTVNLHAYPGA